MYYYKFILFPGLFIFGFCEITQEKKDKLLSDFINYYNLQPNQPFKGSEGYLRSIDQVDTNTYNVDISFKEQDNGPKLMQCSTMIQDIGDMGIAIVNYDMHCGELQQQASEQPSEAKETSIEADQETGPIKLENEVQGETGITSGEQFIAIPRKPTAPCIGCSSFVNPEAEGVNDLANLGVRHLDLHEPNLKHSLDSVISVERQVQVVNGVRYILTLSINFNNCTEIVTDACTFIQTCKISILVKPWQNLRNGSKYKSILSNNCTEEWQFGDNGEVLPELPNNSKPENDADNLNADHERINVKHHEDVYMQPNQEKTLSIDEIRAIEEQIISDDHSEGSLNQQANAQSDEHNDQVLRLESNRLYNDNFIAVTDSAYYATSNLNLDKSKVIDEMLDFFNFSGWKPTSDANESINREKRSYDSDLQVLSLTENYKSIKNSIKNAKYIYKMAQKIVDYLNGMDMIIKNRAINNVIKAVEEEDNDKRFLYIQMQVVIPCDTANCDSKEPETRICNGVIDSSDKNDPQIFNSFCYRDSDNKETADKVREVTLYDPILLRLTKRILMKIESESNETNAIKIKKILSANTHIGSGRTTKISMIFEHTDCNKIIPISLRTNCSTVEQLGTSICEVVVHERQGHNKDTKIIYSCTETTADMTISKPKTINSEMTEIDPKIVEMLQESLQYLELKSNRQNKQKVTNIIKISTNIIAGFLVKIDFTIGYTNCSNANYQFGYCSLLENEPLRTCSAHIWDRSWLVDGRQLDVFCEDDGTVRKPTENFRKKRSLRFITKKNYNAEKHILGGQDIQDPNDANVIKLAKEAMQKYLSSNGNSQPHKIVRVDKATVQVVSGFVTRINFVIAPTGITKRNVLSCYSEIWEQPWLNKKEIIVTCNNIKQKVKRQLPGSAKEQDKTNPIYLKLAEESMQKFLSNSGNVQPHRVVQINKVTTQVVAGSLTRIDFVVVPTNSANSATLNCHSEVWEKLWLDMKEITVNCETGNQRDKREQPLEGGLQEQDPTNPIYLKLADESMQKFLSNSGNVQQHRVVKINKVTTQVVSGSLTRIDFVVAPNDSANSATLNCHSKVWEQPWLDKKEITVNCETGNQRDKREQPLEGGLQEQDPTNPIYLKLADESMQKFLSNSGNVQQHRVVKINKVTTQVVAGSLTRIDFVVAPNDSANSATLKCHSKVWEQPWLDKKEITVNCETGNQRDKREQPLEGGLQEQDPTNPIYLKLADESMQKFLSNSGNVQQHRVVKINKVTTQVVAGSLTRIDFVVAPNDSANSATLNCHSKVWEQPWLDKKEITVNCETGNQRDKREQPLVGGLQEQDPTNPIYLKLADESMQKFLTNSGNVQQHRVVKINKVTTQVVSGSLTRIDFVVAPNDSANSATLNCHSKVWEQPWLDKREITVNCETGNQWRKRDFSMAGGETDPVL